MRQHFVSAFQKVATFTIVNGAKQGGNVASYFCAPDGRVLHVVAGPVDANTFLQEAQWVVNSVQQAMQEARRSGLAFKSLFRKWHAARLATEHGMNVEPVLYDSPNSSDDGKALSYRDPVGE